MGLPIYQDNRSTVYNLPLHLKNSFLQGLRSRKLSDHSYCSYKQTYNSFERTRPSIRVHYRLFANYSPTLCLVSNYNDWFDKSSRRPERPSLNTDERYSATSLLHQNWYNLHLLAASHFYRYYSVCGSAEPSYQMFLSCRN